MTDYNKIAMDNLNGLMREIAEYSAWLRNRATLDSLKDSLKKSMDQNRLNSIPGNEHKKAVIKPLKFRIDTTGIKNRICPK